MDMRDKARSDLYLAQLRTQSAPNTPGFGPMSPSYSMHMKSPRFPPATYTNSVDDEEAMAGVQFAEAKSNAILNSKPFTLQAPPTKATPAVSQTPQVERRQAHMDAAPGEQTYEAVPIPGAYPQRGNGNSGAAVGQAMTSEQRIESPPGSPTPWKR
jgi:hypothetical protein